MAAASTHDLGEDRERIDSKIGFLPKRLKIWYSDPTEIAPLAASLNGLYIAALYLSLYKMYLSFILSLSCYIFISSLFLTGSFFSVSVFLSGGNDPRRSGGVLHRATGERKRHDRRGGGWIRATSHPLPLVWHQETSHQSHRLLSPQRSGLRAQSTCWCLVTKEFAFDTWFFFSITKYKP